MKPIETGSPLIIFNPELEFWRPILSSRNQLSQSRALLAQAHRNQGMMLREIGANVVGSAETFGNGQTPGKITPGAVDSLIRGQVSRTSSIRRSSSS